MSDENRIRRMMAEYVRAVDRRDGAAVARCFTADAVTHVFSNVNGEWVSLGRPLVGPADIQRGVDEFAKPHPPGGWGHHVTSDHLIDIVGEGDGRTAHVNAQFLVLSVRGERGSDDTTDSQPPGTIHITQCGYYDSDLRLVDGEWRISHHRVIGDLPVHVAVKHLS